MKILIVIVLYKFKLKDVVPLKSLQFQLPEYRDRVCFYIYDNSPCPDDDGVGNNSLLGCPLKFISDFSNPGLSKPYNEACKYAEKNNWEWLLLLDQDTSLPANFLSVYFEGLEKECSYNMFVPKVKVEGRGYMSPCLFFHKRGRFMKDVQTGKLATQNYTVINSGLLVNVQAYKACGGYNEKVYLDYNDHEFFNRFKAFNPYIYVLNTELIQDFTSLSKDRAVLIRRFTVLCQCVRAIEKKSFSDRIDYFMMILRRAIHLIVLTKSAIFFKIFFSNYLKS